MELTKDGTLVFLSDPFESGFGWDARKVTQSGFGSALHFLGAPETLGDKNACERGEKCSVILSHSGVILRAVTYCGGPVRPVCVDGIEWYAEYKGGGGVLGRVMRPASRSALGEKEFRD
ncbi:hypothetical protein BaRGS_00009353 [Batillaria attramentaria]|uniref:Uncharacterized protein n=1 Tax=Batillaria attramentaria TaxID=370345 RepID=A0ABD0LJN2_9CAEN